MERARRHGRIAVGRLLLSSLLLLLLPLGASAQELTPPDVEPIVNGVLTADFPSTGALLYGSRQETAGAWCSGTLIGCSTFLTAAHCVENDSDPSRYFVYLQHAGIVGVSNFHIHPDYGFPTADVAVLELAEPVTAIAPSPINQVAPPAPGSPGWIVGFGRSGGNNQDYGLKRAGQIETTSCSGGISNATSVCWRFSSPLGPAGEDSNTCNGDSGGPLFIDTGGGSTVAGVTSGGNSADCLPSDFSFDTNVYAYRDWITDRAGADLGSAACGDVPAVGELGADVIAAFGDLGATSAGARHSFAVESDTMELRVALNGTDDFFTDFDLYVRRGAPPSDTEYDCASTGQTPFESCRILAPTAGEWHVWVRRWHGEGTYQLTSTLLRTPCGPANEGQPCDDGNACTGNDTCQSGECIGAPISGTCDDGNPCTSDDTCQEGVCVATPETGTPCDDGRLCTPIDQCVAGICVGESTPRVDCKEPLRARRAVLVIKDRLVDRRDRLAWRWTAGAETTMEDLGNPTVDEDYALCIYDEDEGVATIAREIEIPAGAGWYERRAGYLYRDRDMTNDGAFALVIRTGTDLRARIAFLAGRETLDLDSMDLPLQQDSQVVVQLVNGRTCWESRHSSAIRNDSVVFGARSD